MASEVVYAEVSPKGRVHFTSETSDTVCPLDCVVISLWKSCQDNLWYPSVELPRDPTVYAEVNVKCRSDRPDRTSKTTHTATCLDNSPWCYVAVTLYFTAVILLITVILLAVKCYNL